MTKVGIVCTVVVFVVVVPSGIGCRGRRVIQGGADLTIAAINVFVLLVAYGAPIGRANVFVLHDGGGGREIERFP